MTLRRQTAAVCGTQGGYENHLRLSERPCASCLVGSATYSDFEIARLIEDFRENLQDRLLWDSYGILRVTYEQVFAEQHHLCGCCKGSDPKLGWHLDLDARGSIRGILCSDCNTGIERLGDDLAGIQRAVTYLQSHVGRGGHPVQYGPVNFVNKPAPSKRMQVCFKHFEEGLPVNTVVILEKLSPDVVGEIHEAWKERHTRAHTTVPR